MAKILSGPNKGKDTKAVTTKKVQYTNKAGKTFAVETTNKNEKSATGYYEGNKKYQQSPAESAKVAPTYYDTQYTNKMGKTYDVKTTQKPIASGSSTQTGVVGDTTSIPGATTQEQTALDPNNYDRDKYYYSDGTWYDKKNGGKVVDAYGNVPGATPMTDEEKIKAQADIPFGDLEKTGADLFGEDNPYKDKGSFEKAILEKFKTESKEDKQYLTDQQQRQKDMELEDLRQMKETGKASAAGAEAALAQGREGIQSIDRPTVITEYKQTIQRDLDKANARFDMAEAERQRAQVELKRAQESGAQDLVQMAQQNLQRAEMEIEQSRTAMMDAQARNVSLALDINADQRAAQQQSIANFNAFSGLVEQGVTLTPDNILSFSKSLSIPFEDAYSYYQGMQSIRDDKSLTMEQKALETQNLQQDFSDRMTGYQTKEAQKLRDYTRLVQSGQYTPAEAGAMLGIPTNENPEYVLDMRIKNAEAKIKEIEASGEPIYGSMDYWAREKLRIEAQEGQAALNELYGIPVSINGSAVKMGMNSELGNLPPEKTKTTNAFGSGIITGYGSGEWSEGLDYYLDGGMGATVIAPVSGEVIQVDTGHKKGEKKSFGNRVKIRMDNGEEIWVSHLQGTNVNVGQIIQAGTVIGTQGNTGTTYGPTGVHLDVTIKKPDGSYYTAKEVQAFLQSAEKLNKKMASGASKGEGTYSQYYQNAISDGMDKKSAEKFAYDMVKAENADLTESEAKAYGAYRIMSEENKLYDELMKGIDPEEFADSIGILAKKAKNDPDAVLTQVLMETSIPENVQRAILSEMRWLEGELRESSGAAISIGEYITKGASYFPRAGYKKSVLDDLKKARETSTLSKKDKVGKAGEKKLRESEVTVSNEAGGEIDFDSIWESAKLAPTRKDVSIWDNL